jgi:hypothetical protein
MHRSKAVATSESGKCENTGQTLSADQKDLIPVIFPALIFGYANSKKRSRLLWSVFAFTTCL